MKGRAMMSVVAATLATAAFATTIVDTFESDTDSWAGSYTVKYGSTAECNTTATPTTVAKTGSDNQVTIPIDFTDSNVFYYKVER